MANEVRQRIVNAVETRLRGITTGNGYNTNLGNNLSVWRDLINAPLDPSELPAGSIWDTEEETSEMVSSRHEHRLMFEVHVAGATDAVVRQMLADLYKAIGTDRLWVVAGSQLAQRTDPVGSQMGIAQKGSAIVGATFKFRIVYRTAPFDQSTLK